MAIQDNFGLNATGSLSSFYDEIVFWEMYKETNRFFVTFEKGRYGILNRRRESIGTMEIDYPHVTSNSGSSASFALGATRNQARFDVFLEEEEKTAGDNHNYNGFITVTELKGTRFFQTTLTSSITQSTTYTYGITASNDDELNPTYFEYYQEYGVGGGNNANVYYRFDSEGSTIQFTSSLSGKKIILEYILWVLAGRKDKHEQSK